MRWDLILPGIATLLGTLTGLQRFEANAPIKVTDPKLKAKLDYRVLACTGLGRDERRWTHDPDETDPNLAMKLELCGVRQFTLSVKCLSYDAVPTKTAQWYLERVYTRLSLPSSQAALNALEVAWIGGGSYTDLSAAVSAEDRIFSIGSKDFMFTTAVTESDDDESIGTIDHAIVTSVYLYGTDGEPLGKQIGPVTIPPL